MKIIIIGASPAAISAACRARRLNESARIIIISDSTVAQHDFLKNKYFIETHQNFRIVEIDHASKTLHLEDTISGQFYGEAFDALISDGTHKALEYDAAHTAILHDWDDDIRGIFQAAMAADLGAKLETNIVPREVAPPASAMPYPSHYRIGLIPPVHLHDGKKRAPATDLSRLTSRRMADYAANAAPSSEIGPIIDYRHMSLGGSGNRAAAIGLSIRRLEESKTDYVYSIICENDCFYKLIYTTHGKVLGACAYGKSRDVLAVIDVLAAALKCGHGIADLPHLELGSPDHPAILLGKIAQNVAAGRLHMAYWDELHQKQNHANTILLDVREEDAPDSGIANAIRIPLSLLRDNIYRLDASKDILVFCDTGKDSYIAARILMGSDLHSTRHLSGGLKYRDLAHANQS